MNAIQRIKPLLHQEKVFRFKVDMSKAEAGESTNSYTLPIPDDLQNMITALWVDGQLIRNLTGMKADTLSSIDLIRCWLYK